MATPALCAPDVHFLGFSEALNKTTFGGFDVAELSGLTYDPQADVYHAVADRAGPIQAHVFTLSLPVTDGALGDPSILDVAVLNDAAGAPLTGANFDGEGAALAPGGGLLISSEGGSATGAQPETRITSPLPARTWVSCPSHLGSWSAPTISRWRA